VYAKLTAGFQSRDPALDLAVALAMASSYSNRPIPVRWAALGELALTGEVRPVPYTEQRLQALARLGVETCFAPPSRTAGPTPADLRVLSVRRVEEAIERYLTDPAMEGTE
jgi:DNA repair protein RadA/Sms